MKRYAIGIDFGTLSARAVLARLENGQISAVASRDYPHGVMDQALPAGKKLARGWALQDPMDYLLALKDIVPRILREADAAGDEVAAIGVDFTCSTTLPTLGDGTPLCTLPEFRNEPNAYVKLWKHHAPTQAEKVLTAAREKKLPWLKNSGGRVSSEWALPKLLQILEEAPALFSATDVYLEAGDWLVWRLTGRLCRSASYACFKNFYRDGYPEDDFYASIHPAFSGLIAGRMRGAVVPLSACAGRLTREMAEELGLVPGIPVAPGMTDAHTGVLAAGLCESGDMLSILGTSACHVLGSEQDLDVTGIAAKVRGGILPGLTSYEANQSMGETFAWFIDNACPAVCLKEAEARKISLHQLMNEKAALLPPGAGGLLALDWFNGNRCILGDSGLSGMILGLTLRTPPQALYRALLEATAYGMRTIVENYEAQGLGVHRIVAMGGVSHKSPLLMQIISDVLGREILVSSAREGAALGAAITAAVAGGAYPTLQKAVQAMGQPAEKTYFPGENRAAYEPIYQEYRQLHDYFGRGGNDVMHRLNCQ